MEGASPEALCRAWPIILHTRRLSGARTPDSSAYRSKNSRLHTNNLHSQTLEGGAREPLSAVMRSRALSWATAARLARFHRMPVRASQASQICFVVKHAVRGVLASQSTSQHVARAGHRLLTPPPQQLVPRRGCSSDRAENWIILTFLCPLSLFFRPKSLCVASASWSFHCSDHHAVLLPLFSFHRSILHTTRLDTLLSLHHTQDPLRSPILIG